MKNITGDGKTWMNDDSENKESKSDVTIKTDTKELVELKKEVKMLKTSLVKALNKMYQIKPTKEIYDASIIFEDFDQSLN
jgi:hypothetical protein